MSQHFTQTPLPIIRTFNSWLHEMYLLLNDEKQNTITHFYDCILLEMYYKGGYSPKQTINEILYHYSILKICQHQK